MNLVNVKRYAAQLEDALFGLDLRPLYGSTVLVTGAAGMLGSCLVDLLRCCGQVRVIALGRNLEEAERRFGPVDDWYRFQLQDVCVPIAEDLGNVDYIIHAASNADPVRYARDPAGTFMANVQGTRNLLDYGISHEMRRFLFVSSGEIYGQPDHGMHDFTEDYCGPLDLSNPRSCYPEGKRAAEVLCQSYIRQYGADAVIARPCHIFGPTMTRRDSRAVSEFLWSAVKGQNIIMKSAGFLERSHCYVVDAAQALLFVLLKGSSGQAYNIANQKGRAQIREFAALAASAGGCQVVSECPSEQEQAGYSKTIHAVLDPSKLRHLGWEARYDIGDGIRETIDILRELDKGDGT